LEWETRTKERALSAIVGALLERVLRRDTTNGGSEFAAQRERNEELTTTIGKEKPKNQRILDFQAGGGRERAV
jgi:hypothetical protein